MSVAALLTVIVILLLPGGVPFLVRLCSMTLILLMLAVAYARWGSVALWTVGGLAAIIAGTFIYVLLIELGRPRKRFLSGGR
jgi:hypothetical protein